MPLAALWAMLWAMPLAGLLPVRLAGLMGERGDVPGWPGSCEIAAVKCDEDELVITAGGLGGELMITAGGLGGGGKGGGKVAVRDEAPPRAPAAEAAKRLAAERLAVLSSNKGTRALSREARPLPVLLLSLLIRMDSDAFLIRMDSDASIVCRSEKVKRISAGGTEPTRPTSITRRSCESVHSSSCET